MSSVKSGLLYLIYDFMVCFKQSLPIPFLYNDTKAFYIFTIFAIGNKIACGDTLISEYILRLTYSSRHKY